jgi:hypothetical protein
MRLVLVREEGGNYEYPPLARFVADWRSVPIFGFRIGRRMVLFDRIMRKAGYFPWRSKLLWGWR